MTALVQAKVSDDAAALDAGSREEMRPRARSTGQGEPIIEAYTLRLRGIRFETHVGVSAGERTMLQELVVDVELTFSSDELPEHDRLSESINYDAVVRRVVEEGMATSYRMLETYARRVVQRLLDDLPATRVRVAVTKKLVPTSYPVAEAVVELIAVRPPPAA